MEWDLIAFFPPFFLAVVKYEQYDVTDHSDDSDVRRQRRSCPWWMILICKRLDQINLSRAIHSTVLQVRNFA